MRVRRKMSKIEQSVFDLVDPIAKQNGCVLVDVEYKKQSDGMHLVVYIDKKGGVNLNDCEAVHNAIDKPLDDLDPTNGASYILNVSSLGLDKDINKDRSLALAVGESVDVKTFAPVDGSKMFNYVMLESFTNTDITILQNNKQIIIPRKQISKITKTIHI